jgi:hypothetical protein
MANSWKTLMKLQVDKMSYGHNGKLMKLLSSWNDKLMKLQADTMTSWWNDRLIKIASLNY